MASTLLAVDDSVTMRKVLEMTFAGQDFTVVTADSPDAALQKLKSEKPDLVISDITLDPKNGYELCKEIKKLSPSTPVLLLSSKQNPFDAAKGSGAQVDDHIDKPFDTTQLIDKVKKLLQAPQPATKPAAAAVAPAPAPAAPAPVAAPAKPVAPAPAPAAAAPAANPLQQRAKTIVGYPPAAGGTPIAAKPAASPPVAATTLPQRTPPAPAVAPAPIEAPAPVAAAATATAAFSHANGQMSAKLEQLGLTPAQVDAVLALSRDVIERVVWEVVPVLAETLIKEEISRLTK